MLSSHVKIGYLADHLETIPTLATLFREQWPDYFSVMSQEKMDEDFRREASRDRLPIRLVVLESSILVGTIVLREKYFPPDQELVAELGGLYVVPTHRKGGIGTELVKAGMNLARQQGCAVIYATTATAEGILRGLGWDYVKNIAHGTEELALYSKRLHG